MIKITTASEDFFISSHPPAHQLLFVFHPILFLVALSVLSCVSVLSHTKISITYLLRGWLFAAAKVGSDWTLWQVSGNKKKNLIVFFG